MGICKLKFFRSNVNNLETSVKSLKVELETMRTWLSKQSSKENLFQYDIYSANIAVAYVDSLNNLYSQVTSINRSIQNNTDNVKHLTRLSNAINEYLAIP